FGMQPLTELTSKKFYGTPSKYDAVELFDTMASQTGGDSILYNGDKNAVIGKIVNFVTQLSAQKRANCAASGGIVTRTVGEDNCTGPETCACPAGKEMSSNGTCITIVCSTGQNRQCGTAAEIPTPPALACGIGTQVCSNNNWSACNAVETQSCTNTQGKVGTQTCILGQWTACNASKDFFVRTEVRDVKGFFSNDTNQWQSAWSDVDVNAKLICTGGESMPSTLGQPFNQANIQAIASAPSGSETHQVLYESPTGSGPMYYDSVNMRFILPSSYSAGSVYVTLNSGLPNTKWTRYSAGIFSMINGYETTTLNSNYLGYGISYIASDSQAGLNGTYGSEYTNLANGDLPGVSGQYIRFKIRLYRNTAMGTSTDSLILKNFSSDFIAGETSISSACQGTYYRVDTDGNSAEQFSPASGSGDLNASGKSWKLLGADKNLLFAQDGNYALEFFSRSTASIDESPLRRINILVKKLPDTIDLGDFCSGIQDAASISDLNLNINWAASSTAEGVYKYRVYASTSPTFESRKLVFESGTSTSTSLNFRDINFSSCGDGKCSIGENCPTDSMSCPMGQICTNGCNYVTSITFNPSPSECGPGMNNPSLDSQCQAKFGTNYACIDGCVPTSTSTFSSPIWDAFKYSSTSQGFCGEGYCDLNEFCPRDNTYCSSGQVCNYGCRSTPSVCGNGICENDEHCNADSSVCGTGYACIAGCRPTTTTTSGGGSGTSGGGSGYYIPMYTLTVAAVKNTSSPCGDGFCETINARPNGAGNSSFQNASGGATIDEYCPFDNRYCIAQGFANGICAGGCISPTTTGSGGIPASQTTLICGDGVCAIGENCPLDNFSCNAGGLTGYACINGCAPASGAVITDPSRTRFDPYKGNYNGMWWFQLELESQTGSRVLSAPKQCEFNFESPFRIPITGRTLQKAIGDRNIDFRFPANALGNATDTNIIIDTNDTPPSFMNGRMLQAFNLENVNGDLNLTQAATFKVDFNKQALPCWPACTIKDANRFSLYNYSPDTNAWTKISTIVDWDNNQMWADLNRIG
ncbi:MAG: hypothetical protein Q7R70_02960, partial [Candidatus Diapherotrites archaeon]|nr:hypothetical protein [Candidatus Diapherotrites archaeon]